MRPLLYLLVFALVAGIVSAASPIGMVKSPVPFTLGKAVVPVAGVPSYPLSVGDEIKTGNAPASITLKGGLSTVVPANTTAVIKQVEGKPTVIVSESASSAPKSASLAAQATTSVVKAEAGPAKLPSAPTTTATSSSVTALAGGPKKTPPPPPPGPPPPPHYVSAR